MVDGVKAELGRTLKQHLETTPLKKITVSKLAEDVGITRQAFYYHFQDVYDLALWVFETDVADHILQHASYDQWADGFRQLLHYLRRWQPQVYGVLASLPQLQLVRFFHAQFRIMMQAIVQELRADLEVPESACSVVVNHFTAVVLGHMVHWLATDMAEDPDELVDQLEFLLRGQVREALTAYAALESPEEANGARWSR